MAARTDLAAEAARLDAEIKAAEASKDEDEEPDEDALSPAEIKKLKSERTVARKNLRAIDASLIAVARRTVDATSPADAPVQTIGVLRSRIEKLVADHCADVERSTLAWYDNLVDKYGITLQDLEAERGTAVARLEKHLKELGYG